MPTIPPNFLAFRWNNAVFEVNRVVDYEIVGHLSDRFPAVVDDHSVDSRPPDDAHIVYRLGPDIPLPGGAIPAASRTSEHNVSGFSWTSSSPNPPSPTPARQRKLWAPPDPPAPRPCGMGSSVALGWSGAGAVPSPEGERRSPVSLTSHLADPASPVRELFETRYPHIDAVRFADAGNNSEPGTIVVGDQTYEVRTVARFAPGALQVPPPGHVLDPASQTEEAVSRRYDRGLAGMAFDYRLRFLLASQHPDQFVAASGARITSSTMPSSWNIRDFS